VSDKSTYEKCGAVAHVTLNRPEVLNAVDREMSDRLVEVWQDFADDPELRVAVITGAGDAFTSGGDLRSHAPEWADVDPMSGRKRLEHGLSGITRGPLATLPKPIIASINGWCVGHGLEIAMACDLRIASDQARFGALEVRHGMQSADGGIVRLVNTCGVGFAMELVLTGEAVTAERTYRANMIDKWYRTTNSPTPPPASSSRSCAATPPPSPRRSRPCSKSLVEPCPISSRVETVSGCALCADNTAASPQARSSSSAAARPEASVSHAHSLPTAPAFARLRQARATSHSTPIEPASPSEQYAPGFAGGRT
jgi:enoyl-CoA hydratase/carnithine racemase